MYIGRQQCVIGHVVYLHETFFSIQACLQSCQAQSSLHTISNVPYRLGTCMAIAKRSLNMATVQWPRPPTAILTLYISFIDGSAYRWRGVSTGCCCNSYISAQFFVSWIPARGLMDCYAFRELDLHLLTAMTYHLLKPNIMRRRCWFRNRFSVGLCVIFFVVFLRAVVGFS